MRGDPPIELDPALVEESVLLASDGWLPPIRRAYRRERNAVYEIVDSEKREPAFRDLDARWFRRLRLGAPLLGLLAEFDSVLAGVTRCIVLLAGRARDEGADLHETREPRPALAVRLTAPSLLEFDRVRPLLRSELLHVEDMLDPAFGYERDLPSLAMDPLYEKLVRDRYRVLWNVSADGRLASRGQLPAGGEARRRREFLTQFSMLGPEADLHFEKFFRGPRPTHSEILRFALSAEGRVSGRCPLCRFATTRFLGVGEPLDEHLEEAVRQDFPDWSRSQGICVQCADLYEARVRGGTASLFSRPAGPPMPGSIAKWR